MAAAPGEGKAATLGGAPGARAALRRPLGCLRAEGADGCLHLLPPDARPLPSDSRGLLLPLCVVATSQIVRREGVCGSGDVTYVQDLSHWVGRERALGPRSPGVSADLGSRFICIGHCHPQ